MVLNCLRWDSGRSSCLFWLIKRRKTLGVLLVIDVYLHGIVIAFSQARAVHLSQACWTVYLTHWLIDPVLQDLVAILAA